MNLGVMGLNKLACGMALLEGFEFADVTHGISWYEPASLVILGAHGLPTESVTSGLTTSGVQGQG